jgi:hypothetical protein
MRLTELNDTIEGGNRTISMNVVWEDVELPNKTLYFSADGRAAQHMAPATDAFAIACLPLAAWMGERRLQLDGALCTRLRAGLLAINRVYADWYPEVRMVSVEPTSGYRPTAPPSERRLASLLSGGVDGLATLRQNRLDYPLEHPESIRACITLFGINHFDLDENGPVPERLAAFEDLRGRLRSLAEAEKFELLPVRTNVRSLGFDYRAWTRIGFAAGHIAVAQLFHGHFDKVLFSSDGAGPNPPHAAAHPMITPWFSTNAVTVQSDQDAILRTDKIALLANWEWGRRLMQPCHYVRIPEQGRINCGQCEKCVRTMLTLIGLGRLKDVSAFAGMDVTPDLIRKIPVHSDLKASLLAQSIPLLRTAGRDDLIRAIRQRMWRYRFDRLLGR